MVVSSIFPGPYIPFLCIIMKHSRTILENLSKGIISFMDHNPHLTWMVDYQHNLIYANQAMMDYFRSDSQSVIGSKLAVLFSPELASTLEDKIKRVFSRKLPDHSTVRSTMPDGAQRYFQLTLFPSRRSSPFRWSAAQRSISPIPSSAPGRKNANGSAMSFTTTSTRSLPRPTSIFACRKKNIIGPKTSATRSPN